MDAVSRFPARRAAAEGHGRQDPAGRVLGRAAGRFGGYGPGAGLRGCQRVGQRRWSWAQSVSTDAATFEAWIRTTARADQTIVLGSSPPGATPRVSVGADQVSVYWNTGGSAPGWTSADATPVTDGQWRRIAVVFDGGALTFYKDGVATADQLSAGAPQQAAGTFQLGAGFGATTGFTGEIMTRACGRWRAPPGGSPRGAGRRCLWPSPA